MCFSDDHLTVGCDNHTTPFGPTPVGPMTSLSGFRVPMAHWGAAFCRDMVGAFRKASAGTTSSGASSAVSTVIERVCSASLPEQAAAANTTSSSVALWGVTVLVNSAPFQL